MTVPRVRRSTFGTCTFATAGPTVWYSLILLPDYLCHPTVESEQFRHDLKTHLKIREYCFR